MPATKTPKPKARKKQPPKSTKKNPNPRQSKALESVAGGLQAEKPGKLSAEARRFVLRSIAEYQPYAVIASDLLQAYNYVRTPDTLRNHYGANAQYKTQIQAYRDRFNTGMSDEPLASRRHVIQRIERAIDKAELAGDYKGVASLIAQLREMMGYKVATEIEINHNHTGGLTPEQRVNALWENRQVPPVLNKNPMALLPGNQIVDVQPE